MTISKDKYRIIDVNTSHAWRFYVSKKLRIFLNCRTGTKIQFSWIQVLKR